MNISKQKLKQIIVQEYNNILSESGMMTEEQFDEAAGKKDACYHKVKARYDVWPSAYASGALSKCRKVGAANWGNKSKKKESVMEYDVENLQDSKDFYNYMKENYWRVDESTIEEAEYQGRKVNFGHGGPGKGKGMSIKKNNPERRKAFRARHNCDNPGPRHKARYWACRTW